MNLVIIDACRNTLYWLCSAVESTMTGKPLYNYGDCGVTVARRSVASKVLVQLQAVAPLDLLVIGIRSAVSYERMASGFSRGQTLRIERSNDLSGYCPLTSPLFGLISK